MAFRRILIGSPVCQKPEILKAFLDSLSKLEHQDIRIDFAFVDDNQEEQSSRILKEFKRNGAEVFVFPALEPGDYRCDESTHYWSNALMLRVGEWKNRIIQFALDREYDGLFLVDSDLVLNPVLLEHLAGLDKDIVSEIFWTCWHPGQRLEPNVWLFDEYDLAQRSPGEEISQETVKEREEQFLEQLKTPGVYEVGGLGACTLISRKALLKGVDFSHIPNLTIRGEDRFFCIRAAVLGLKLFVDTSFPAYHIYRPDDLKTIPQFVDAKEEPIDPTGRAAALDSTGGSDKTGISGRTTRIVLSMIVRNEEGRYLERVLDGVGRYVDEVVIIDDASGDHTADLCERLLQNVPHRLVRNETSLFANEAELRKKQWNETLKAGPDWILCLDADEVPEKGFWTHLREMVEDDRYDVYGFRLYDMWSETEYREDPYWNAHESSRVFLMRYKPDYTYVWKETPQHCGRFPANLEGLPQFDSRYRVKHYGWARLEDRKRKYERYRRLDPQAIYGIRRQYDSILDSYPHLLPWREGDCD